jgi:NAD(P)-dependent dehydrogenase (short-subunit alcohol dehydrogenase family)
VRPMKTSLKGKVVVVTGSSRGIGCAIAEGCARAGASVVISSRSQTGVSACVEEMQRDGLSVKGFVADVSREGDIERLFKNSLAELGKIDVWVNNAGISGGYRTIQSMSAGEIKQVIDINLMGTFYACRLLIPYFLASGGGNIINMSGRGGRGNASPYQSPYGASKAAVTSLTRSLAAENKGKPLSINCLFPGMVETDIYRDVQTCPETEPRMGIMPVLLKAFATPMERVQRVAVEMCAVKPGSITGKCYSAEQSERYMRALMAVPDFIRVMRKQS